MSSETVEEVKTEEATEPVANEIIEETKQEEPTEQIKQEETITTPVEQPTAKAKPKAQPKKLARSVKVVELVECNDCGKKMLPKSLRNTHPHYCKGQPTETLPVNRQKASYGIKVEQKLRKEIEEEIKAKYANQEQPKQVVQHSQPVEVKAKSSAPVVPVEPKQLTARELLEASYKEIRRAKREEHMQKINSFKSKMF